MTRNTSALFAFSWPVLVFVAALVLSCWLALPARGDDFDDHLAALKAQNAAAAKPHDHADPFAAKNAGGCHCKGDQCYHDCEGVCNDITCPFRPVIDAPAEEMIRASDGRTYPRSAWPNGDPWAGVRQAPTYYAPPRQAFFAPAFGGGGFSCGPSG